MRRSCLAFVVGIVMLASIGLAQQAPAAGPYKVLKTARVGGEGGFDYVYADVDGRRLYIPRSGNPARITVFNLDTLEPTGEIPNASARGAAVDPKSNHGFASSKPVVMWDTKTLATIKTIDVEGNPDGILFDPFNERVYAFSHSAPNATVIDAKDGSVVGTIDLGGAPEQAVSDGKGHLYVDIEDKNNIAVVDAATLKVTAHYDLAGKGGTPAGLAMDVKNHRLFSVCSNKMMIVMDSESGNVLATPAIGERVDGAAFDPVTSLAYSSNGEGTLTIVREEGPTKFSVIQNVPTQPGARTITLDPKTHNVYLPTAKFEPASESTKDTPRPRPKMVPGTFRILVVGK